MVSDTDICLLCRYDHFSIIKIIKKSPTVACLRKVHKFYKYNNIKG